MCFLLISFFSKAQKKDSLSVTFGKCLFKNGDTIPVFVQCYGDGRKTAAATLQIVVENEFGRSIKMRWPILNSVADGELIIPDSLPNGKYTISFAVQQKFFRIYGTVNPPIRTSLLNTNLLTGKGEWLAAQIPVEADGSFVIKNWLFENNATLVFSRQKKVNSDLDITINTWLDSTYDPVALLTKEFYVGTPPSNILLDSAGKNLKSDFTKFNEKENLLPSVIVTGKKKTKAEKFNETYSSGLFQSMDEKVFDFMSETSDALGYNSVLDYLQGRVAGLQISNQEDGTRGATWRGSTVAFFIDEMQVEADQMNTLSTADIAIVKVYPPPFYGSAGGSGGGIAVYTRRGEYSTNSNIGNRHIFQIKGYTPLQTVLFLK